jgi:starch synthase
MYSMRYGTIPIVRTVGGLRDTVSDLSTDPWEGRGFRFDQFEPNQAHNAIWNAFQLYQSADNLRAVRQRIMSLDFSWQHAAQTYTQLYRELT